MFPAPDSSVFRRRIYIAILFTALFAGAALILQFVRPTYYVQTEYELRDAIARDGRTTPPNPDLIFLAIDKASVTLDPTLDVEDLFASTRTEPAFRGALGLMAKGWPWDREVYALLLERLIGAGARVVVFDCLFPEPAAGDDAFRAALDRFRSQVVLGSNFVTPEDVDLTRRFPSRYDQPTTTLISPNESPDDRVGFTNFFAGENRIVRGAQFRVAFRSPQESTATYLSLSARAAVKAGYAALLPNDFAEHVIRFTGAPRAGFRPHPVFEIFVPEYWEHNYRSGELLRDKIVVIGAEGSWQQDELLTPFGPMPGAELHLNALNALLHGEYIRDLSPFGAAGVTVFAAILGGILCLTIRSPWLRVLALVATNAIAPLFALWIYNHQSVSIPAIAPLFAFNGNVLVGLVSDFTFERLERLKLRSTLKTRDDLTQMIVHDLRSPLTIVAGYVGALQQIAGQKLGPNESRYLAEALRSADDMRDMITTLLDVNRLEAGEMPLRLEKIDIVQVVRDAAKRFGPVLNRRTIRYDLPSDQIWIECDGNVVRRVIENLVNNAIKYTAIDGTITLRVQPNESEIEISVTDNGAGIPADKHKRIFEKFGQVDGGGEHRDSSGIGLSFCRMAVEAHGGSIGVSSEVGRGSTFWFKLPARVNLSTVAKAHASSGDI